MTARRGIAPALEGRTIEKVVVRDRRRVNEVLVPIYEQLDQPIDPAVTGAVEDEVGGLDVPDVLAAVKRIFASRFDAAGAAVWTPARLDVGTSNSGKSRLLVRSGASFAVLSWSPLVYI